MRRAERRLTDLLGARRLSPTPGLRHPPRASGGSPVVPNRVVRLARRSTASTTTSIRCDRRFTSTARLSRDRALVSRLARAGTVSTWRGCCRAVFRRASRSNVARKRTVREFFGGARTPTAVWVGFGARLRRGFARAGTDSTWRRCCDTPVVCPAPGCSAGYPLIVRCFVLLDGDLITIALPE
jgi:hypothetical protein